MPAGSEAQNEMLDFWSFWKKCLYSYTFYLRSVAYKSEPVHQRSHIICALTRHYVVISRHPASVEYLACRSHFGWPLFGFSPHCLCQRHTLWAKNAENEEQLLRLDQRVQGAGTGIVDDILLGVQRMIIANVTQTERAAAAGSISTRLNTLPLNGKGVVLHFWRRDCLFSFSQLSDLLLISVSSGQPIRDVDWRPQVKHFWQRIQRYKITVGAVPPHSNLSPHLPLQLEQPAATKIHLTLALDLTWQLKKIHSLLPRQLSLSLSLG